MANLLFFASVKDKMGMPATQLALPASVTNVASLMLYLQGLGDPYAHALAGGDVQVAVNQTHARGEDPVQNGDEIAFFPPVSGG
ncbi:molybdopterin converting factor subunit 1 [Magnetococcus marinus]|uniref:molybdopterin converting factor subunit 1 n=1 Tax=Magnetococcus marinus TaxID=1124597 RepID=UPI000038172F|nr:molybdopterin converting factor subunit 1 [Magnetococcus marinus]